ncbi:Carbohydrate esterase [Phytophthora cinnamomi]|uniref:Carbohydrate esterase n=1 Tax=Phytophthora cinnamomi TaxID=4785 RepID=UPI00355A6A0A|nr:Carbohydrate esterase [Phytophthora cinnamomi]
MPTTYGSVGTDNVKDLPGAKSSAPKVLLNTVVVAAIIALLINQFGPIAVNIITAVVVVVYLVLFVGFCCAAVPYASTPVLVPFIAIKLQFLVVRLLLAYAVRGFKPAFPQWTLTYELTVMMMRFTCADYGHLVADKNAHLLRAPFQMHGKSILKANSRLHGTVPEKLVANGMEHMWLRDAEKKDTRVVVIHFHGGAYVVSDPLQDVELANQTHTKLKQILKEKYQIDASVDVLLANYRMAPQFLYPTALDDCFTMYKYVLDNENIAPNHVVLSGDSAGGEMTLTNCMRLRDTTPELKPAAALCYSPLVDLEETGGDDITPHCLLAANFLDNSLETYLSSLDDPNKRFKVSPINQNLKDLPPTFVQFGTLERFYEQGLRFKANADAQGVTNMELDLLKNIAHDPVMFPTAVSPAAEGAIRNACAFAAKHLAPILKAR